MAVAASHAGRRSWLRRVTAYASAQVLDVVVVPDARAARTHGLDLAAAGLRVVETPRHATVLVVVGDVPPGLAEAAATVYGQMPSPRAILRVGDTPLPASLPVPDATSALSQDALIAIVARLRGHLMHRSSDPLPSIIGQHAQISDEPTASAAVKANHAADDEHHGAHGGTDHAGHGMDHGHHGMDHGHLDHVDDMNHGGMDHGDMMDAGGFMSMVAMTRDLPRSPDGLPMERVEASFGPLFPGLPGGLALTFSLDGDAVAGASIRSGVMTRDLPRTWDGPVAGFAGRLARLDPLTPATYELLAILALERASGAARSVAGSWLATVERERIISHLGWLSALGDLLGDPWLSGRAADAQARIRAPNAAGIVGQRPAIDRLLAELGRRPLLRRRLAAIGVVDIVDMDHAIVRGPVARGAGLGRDARTDRPEYRALGFTPVVRTGRDALARFQVRCAEIGQSLDLIAAVGTTVPERPTFGPGDSGRGQVSVETPRGAATLAIALHDGQVRVTRLDDPSTPNAALIPGLTRNLEVADALVAAASLDLSPWEMDR